MATEVLIRPDGQTAGTLNHGAVYLSASATGGVVRLESLSVRDTEVFGTAALKASFQRGVADIAESRSRTFEDVEALIADLRR